MSFVNPLFILGGLAAAIPILLHLIKREHARKIEFPTLMFLRRISKKTIRYQKLRHLLLLLLRILALLFIVFAFMRPYRQRTQAAAAQNGTTSTHIILLDNSMSMGYRNRWDLAKKAAVEILQKLSPGDKCAVLEFSDRVAARTQLSDDPSDAAARIQNDMELSDHTTRYAQALNAAEKLALDAGTGRRIIYLISDFQKNAYGAEERDFHLSAGIEIRSIDVGSDDFSNLAIRNVHVVEAETGAGGGSIIKSSVMNFGNQDRKNVQATLLMDGRRVAEKRIDTLKGEPQALEFQLPGLISGIHPVVLEIDDPYLAQDNRFYMTLDSRGKTPVLVVETPGVQGRRAPSFFLAKALNVDALSQFRLNTVAPQNMVIAGELLIWNNISGGSAAMQKQLRDFVAAGRGLAVVLGDSALPADFNRSFGSWLPVRMMGTDASARIVTNRPLEQYSLMTDIRLDHPIFQPFNKPHSGTFTGARFFHHARVAAGQGAEVAARFDNGDPALVSIDFMKGRVLIFTSSADDVWNDLPLKAVYAPFWHQILRYLDNFREPRHWREVGDIINSRELLMEADLRQAKGNPDPNEAIVVLDPEKRRLAITPGSDLVEIDRAGFYEIRTMNASAAVAANITPRESDLAHGNAEEMIAGWMSSKPAVFSQEARFAPEEKERSQHPWTFLLIGAALLLISESILSDLRLTVDDLRLKTDVAANRHS